MPAKNTKRLSVDLGPRELQKLKELSERMGAPYVEIIRRLIIDPTKVIPVGPRMDQVSPVSYWYKHGRFTPEQAVGAFFLAYQQGLDGMGTSIQAWMGLTDSEYNEYMRGRMPKCPSR